MSLAPEEAARANFYALLANLLYQPPDARLIAALAESPGLAADDQRVSQAWAELCGAARDAQPDAVRDEFDSAFVGTGRAPVTVYAGAYSARYTNEVPLAELRDELRHLGFARRAEVGEPEDHISALLELMRHLIAQGTGLEEQKRVFERWIRPIAEPLCTAIESSEHTRFYKHVARFANSFLALEQYAFEML